MQLQLANRLLYTGNSRAPHIKVQHGQTQKQSNEMLRIRGENELNASLAALHSLRCLYKEDIFKMLCKCLRLHI